MALRAIFLEGRCVGLPGFTRHMLDKPRSSQPAPTQSARTLGGPGATSEDVVERCLTRAQKYARLAAEVTRAEFPPFDILSAYRVFHLEVPELRSRGGVAARARLSLTEQHTGDLQRLAKFSNNDAASVAAQLGAITPWPWHSRSQPDATMVVFGESPLTPASRSTRRQTSSTWPCATFASAALLPPLT